MRFSHILVPIDFSDHSAHALDHAIELAKHFEGKIHLLHCYAVYRGTVTPYGVSVPESFDRECRDAAQSGTRQWADKVAAEGVEVDSTISKAVPADAIPQIAEEIGADLIVMGSRGLTGLKHVVLGSVAERTVRHATCPVLTVPS